MPPVRAALLGAGLFAEDVYANLFRTNEAQLTLAFVWSRSASTAEDFVSKHAPGAAPLAGDTGLQAVLGDASVTFVVVVLPVPIALQVVERCLAAGKHVVHEKPVAATVEAALAALQRYHSLPKQPLWLFAENYRFEDVFLAAAQLASRLGTVVKIDMVADLPMDARNKYHGSAWRRDTAQCPGGFLMDSAVHFMAALRLVAAGAGAGEAVSASAIGVHARPDLSGPDSVAGVVRFATGCPATVSISLAANHVRWSLAVTGTAGSLEVSRGGWAGSRGEYALTHKLAGDAEPTVQRFAFSGVQNEMRDFLSLVQQHGAAPSKDAAAVQERLAAAAARTLPEEGARDLALMEALLASAAGGGVQVAVQAIPAAGQRPI